MAIQANNDITSIAKTLTATQIRVLHAVSAGKVMRVYRDQGAHSATVRELERRKLVGSSFFGSRERFELTGPARAALAAKKPKQVPATVTVRLTRDQCRLLAAAAELMLAGMQPWATKEHRSLEAARQKLEKARQ